MNLYTSFTCIGGWHIIFVRVMRAYNTSIGILLPRLRIDWIGVNLEGFMHRILLAAKASLPDNLYYPPYPVVRTGHGSDMAVTDSREIIRSAENQLARYTILPQEGALADLYRRLVRDAGRAVYPKAWERVDFYSRYLEKLDFPPLVSCFDALWWYLLGHTTRTLSASQGLELLYAFFLEEGATASDRGAVVRERFAAMQRKDTLLIDSEMPLPASPFPAGSQFIIVGSEDAPIEGPNTVFATFHEAPLALRVACRVVATDGRTELSNIVKQELIQQAMLLARTRLGLLPGAPNTVAEAEVEKEPEGAPAGK